MILHAAKEKKWNIAKVRCPDMKEWIAAKKAIQKFVVVNASISVRKIAQMMASVARQETKVAAVMARKNATLSDIPTLEIKYFQ